MSTCPDGPDLIHTYALVTYLPEPLRRFLNNLRSELVPGCHLRAHVTVLPPRELACQAAAWNQLLAQSRDFEPFEVELGEIAVFPGTDVVYLSIRKGGEELVALHDRLATGALAFEEPFIFRPHVTLAQNLKPHEVPPARKHAMHKWAAYSGPRAFTLDGMTFVRRAPSGDWIDLGELSLGSVEAAAS